MQMNKQMSIVFLHTNKLPEIEIKKAILFTITSKKIIKYLGINWTKEVEYL